MAKQWGDYQAEAQTRFDILGLIFLLIFFCASALLFRSIDFALIVVASLGVHELGHACALARLGLHFQISFGLVGAATWSSSKERAWLTPFQNAAIYLAGPLFSLFLALLALGLYEIMRGAGDDFLILANFSAQLGFLNLLPWGALTDGGKVVQRIIGSLSTRQRLRTVYLPLFFTFMILLLYWMQVLARAQTLVSASFVLGLVLVGAWLAGSLLVEKRRLEEPLAVPQPSPLAGAEVFWLVFMLWGLLIFFIEIMASTPFWLTPEYARGCFQNLVDLLTLIRPFIDRLVFLIHLPGF